MNFGQKLKDLRRENGLTQEALSQQIGVSAVAIRSWERCVRSPGAEHLISLSRIFDVSVDSMLGIHVSNEADDLSKRERSLLLVYRDLDEYGKRAVDGVCDIERERVSAQKAAFENSEKVVRFEPRKNRIPYFSIPSAAGFSAPLDDDHFKLITVDGCVPPETDYAINIQGNSMFPYIHDGDMVFVKKQEELNVGDVGIFCVDGALYCKQYYHEEGGTVMLVSANPALKDTNIVLTPESGSSLSVCGKVLLGKRIELPKYLFEQ